MGTFFQKDLPCAQREEAAERLYRHGSLSVATQVAPMTTRKEKILFLYGSQTGNSEQAAKDLCKQCATKLTPEIIRKLAATTCKDDDNNSSKDEIIIIVEPVHMQLDDFLELERAAWTRLVVIVVSSYGVGSAPLGAYRFRELCDAWAAAATAEGTMSSTSDNKKLLDGVHFAMCGLGDSKYTTYFQNPAAIDKTLRQVGATRVGPLGKADASGTGSEAQLDVIDRWMDGIWPHLAQVVSKEPLSTERLQEMQRTTVALCRKINPDFLPEPRYNPPSMMLLISIAVSIFAILAYFLLSQTEAS